MQESLYVGTLLIVPSNNSVLVPPQGIATLAARPLPGRIGLVRYPRSQPMGFIQAIFFSSEHS